MGYINIKPKKTYETIIRIEETTTDATVTEVFSLAMEEGDNYKVITEMDAQSVDGTNHLNKGLTYNFRRLAGGSVLRSTGAYFYNAANGGATIRLEASGNNVKLYITGVVGKTMNWKGYIAYDKVR